MAHNAMRHVMRSGLVCALVFVGLAVSVDTAVAAESPTLRLVGLSSVERDDDFEQLRSKIVEKGVSILRFDREHALVTLEYEASKLFPTLKPAQVLEMRKEDLFKALDEALKGASTGTFWLKFTGDLPEESLILWEIKIGVLDCKGCRYTAYVTALNQAGVERGNVDVSRNVLQLWVDPNKAKRSEIESALRKIRVEVFDEK